MNKDIKRYLFYAFTSSWLFWGGVAILTQLKLLKYGGSPLFLVPFIMGGIMPAICELWLKKKYGSKEDFKAFTKNILSPKHSVELYLLVIGSAFLFMFLPTLWGGATMKQPLYIALMEFPIMIIGGGLEEIGWRGFLQPELEKKLPSSISSLIVGSIWAVWHLPLWFIIGSNQSSMNGLWFFINAIALAFLLTATYSVTKSIFLCIISHALLNAFWDVFVPNTEVLSAC
ncbi:MAG: CPBP family intramembrane glutamic endopeptidase, partial [Ruminiclostridium sp.]